MLIDRFGREVTDLRITATHVCNFRCFFCHMEGEESEEKGLSPQEIGLVCKAAVGLGISTAKITGGEPTVRRDITEVVRSVKDSGIGEVSMTTNGFSLEAIAVKLKEAGLNRVNVSLHTMNRERFKKITGVDGLDRVLRGVKVAIEAGLTPLKLNFVATKLNLDEVFRVIDFASEVGADVHLIELHPVGMGKESFNMHERLEGIESILSKIAKKVEYREKHIRPRYVLPSGVTVEVVKPFANPLFCAGCNRIRLTADGKLKTCLYREDKVIDIMGILRGDYQEHIKLELLRTAFLVANKIREPNFKFTLKTDHRIPLNRGLRIGAKS
jgi:cyclic pyranopterin phosphate synthase